MLNQNIFISSKINLTQGDIMDIAITKMSSKGQIVIPAEMRKDVKEGEKLVIIKNKDQLILKKASEMETKFLDDLEFARRTEEAWKRYDKGEFKEMNFDEFIEELKKC
jgi:AbrB family looped-hinge helix DNA binding protein